MTPRNGLSRFLETELRLVRFDPDHPRRCAPEWTPGATAVTEFSDGFPILVISRASLAELNSRLPAPLPMERFRPNIVVDGLDAYDEDRVHELRGDGVAIRIVKPCMRCSITTTDQQKGERDGVEPLQTLKTFRFDPSLRGVAFGQNAIPITGVGQTLSVGQPPRCLEVRCRGRCGAGRGSSGLSQQWRLNRRHSTRRPSRLVHRWRCAAVAERLPWRDGLNTSTRSRPWVLATYKAMSARRATWSNSTSPAS